MLKKMVATVLASVGLLSLNANPTLAERAVNYSTYRKVYPSTCSIAIEGKRSTCDYVVFGAFNDATANIKLCSSSDCFVLMLTPSQLSRISNGQNFSVYNLAWQRGSSIVRRWDTSMQCGFSRTDGIGCVGELDNGNAITVYTE
ncbi:hypothetical protein [Iningainema tapete]|uniref:Uncharacterized protein n=1 Tax=Iningainema tapete BLCC-T55 TaxID=2748662 RepID=A0A8J7BZE4_9CYAN|nr:hypothetical protein [Iningainema tapete]MBD2777467.1 hypothetical protein [Iningainema tapete BLCC-T55]